MICLGIDPGSIRCGYAVVTDGKRGRPRLIDAGFLAMSAKQRLSDRLRELISGLNEVLWEHLRLSKAVLCIEDVYAHPKRPQAALVLAQARGAVIATVTRESSMIDVIEPAPSAMKAWLTGSGKASKVDVQRSVMRECGLSRMPEPHDVADAIGLALYGHHVGSLNAAVQGTS